MSDGKCNDATSTSIGDDGITVIDICNPGDDYPAVDVTSTVSFRIVDAEEPGVVTLSDHTPTVGTTVVATLTDGDGSTSFGMGEGWQWARSPNGSTDWANISGATSDQYTPDDDDGGSYLRASVTYTDNRGSGKTASAVTTSPVPSENNQPAFPATETGQRTVEENTGGRFRHRRSRHRRGPR